MNRNKQIFSAGLFMGLALAALFCFVSAPRYGVSKSENQIIKLDKWTGETWQFSKGNWEKIEKVEQDWKAIDNALYSALNLKQQRDQGEKHTSDLLQVLKDKYPVLDPVPNEEILERINIVYSKAILTDMYLKNIEKIHEAQENTLREEE
jgi:hypothetical protein